jgi:signal transduction histidine kinase
MRAPVQKKRPRRTDNQSTPAGGPEQTPAVPVGKGRPTHVRNRLIVAVAVVAAAVAAAGAPSVLAASQRLSDSQDLVTLAQRTQDALTLAHSLADERDEVTSYIAAGRPKDKAPSEQRGTRVDREVEDLRADSDTPAGLRTDLDAIASVRRAALTGKSSALEAHQAYSATVTRLHRLAEDLAEQMPPHAGSGAHSLAELDSAVQQSAAARGLLLAALNVPSTEQTVIDPITGLPTTTTTSSGADAKRRAALSTAAQQARLRSDAALADFRDTAPQSAVHSYDTTVTGPEADAADTYLAKLTDQPELGDAELGTSVRKLEAALSARVEMMRGVESSLYDHRTKDLARLRDDDVTAWEIRVALLGALILVTIGISTAMARTLTRPLSVLRRGSARLAGATDPVTEEPVRFTGRNDEFAEVVRSVNTLHAHAVALHERVTTLETDRKHLVGQRQKMADAREDLRTELADAAAQLERLRHSIGSTFVSLALRTLGLVERQLTVIEGLEEREQDPDRLSTLFKLDHFATVMRRHSENLLVLAGSEHVQQSAGPVPLVDVVRAAVSEIERYDRLRIAALPPHAHVAGFAADDLSHLLAELMENATASSPPDLPVEISGWLMESGEVMLSVQDEGIGMTAERLTRLNTRLAEFEPDSPYDQEGEEGLGLGLYVVARIAHRHGVRVRLREQKQGGTAVVVVLPHALLTAAPSSAVPASGPVSGGAAAFSLPGADAEVNSHVLPVRTAGGDRPGTEAGAGAADGAGTDGDPLAALVEQAVGNAAEGAGEAVTEAEAPAPEGPAEHPGTPEAAEAAEAAEAVDAPGAPEAPETAAADDETVAGAPDAAPAPAHRQSAPQAERAREHAAVPGQRVAETTMELLIPAPAAEPHPAGDPEQATDPEQAAEPQPATAAADPDPAVPALEDPDPAQPADHARTPDATDTMDAPVVPGAADVADPVTAKGLPKRTPNITAPTQAPGPRTRSVDAEALRRRLGGFRRGAEAGRRDVAAEIAEKTGQNRKPADPSAERTAAEAMGGTVEEASS